MRTSATLIAAGVALIGAAPSVSAQNGLPDFSRSLSYYLGMEGRVMWVDATANIDRITNLAGVQDVVARCRKANLTTIVVDAKPVSGHVTYTSKLAEPLRTWKGKTYPAFDTLAAFLAEGHRAGLEVAASLNVLAEGHKQFGTGLAYRKPEWQSVSYVVDRSLTARDGAKLSIRGVTDPTDPTLTTVHGEKFLVETAAEPGKRLAVAMDQSGEIVGIIDATLLADEPLVTPDDGYVMELADDARRWADAHLRSGDTARFTAVGRRVPIAQAGAEKVAVFVNPLHPEARAYELALLRELAANYAVDAIVMDRMRYSGIYADYSDITRVAFERWLGRRVTAWPEDILRFDPVPGEPVRRGPLFRSWLEFRARVIRDLLREAVDTVRSVRPDVRIGAYVGSWFTEYYGVGVNWASEKFPVPLSWASQDYNEAGYAEMLDWLSTGCYYGVPTRDDARAMKRSPGGTVEAAAELSVKVTANSVPVYAGLYALNYEGRPAEFVRAIQTATRKSHGVMLFDLSYIYDYGWWPLLEQAFPRTAVGAHADPAFTAEMRAAFDAIRMVDDVRSAADRLPVVPYQQGGG